jgi:flavin-dependent dehydrogenase
MAAAAGDLEGFYVQAIRSRWPRIHERLASGRLLDAPRAIGPLALQCRGAAAAGAVLVGDAAGFYDPFTGEGVTLALRTARLAAAEVDAALRSGRPIGRLSSYERAREDATRDKFRFNRLVQAIVAWPGAANAVARRLARRPDLADHLVGIAGDFVPARSAFGARFLLELLRA